MPQQSTCELQYDMLGLHPSTAYNRLRKLVLFDLAKQLNKTTCFRCGEEITDASEFSIEHITPWMYDDNPTDLFWDLNNISFSHFKCNAGAARSQREIQALCQ